MRDVLVHAHIFKNAGTTFDDSLRRHFGDGFIDHRDDQAFIDGRNACLLDFLEANKQVNALSSHSLHFRITGNDTIRVNPVYFLRHPVARVWSVYNFEKQQTGVDTEGARRAKAMDLNSYVDWYMEAGSPATIRNIHTIFLSGDGPSPDNMDTKFAKARDYLATGETNFAVVERYDKSMLVLEQKLAGRFPGIDLAYVRRNVSNDKPRASAHERAEELMAALTPEVADKLLAANALDMALYELANQRLDAALAKIGDVQVRLSALCQRCQGLQAD